MISTDTFTVRETARSRALATLERYVRLETPTGDSENITAFVDQLAARYRDLGGTVALHPVDGGAHLVADFPGTGELAHAASTLLIGHSDTVWPRGTLDGDVPWTNDGTRISGPGAYDMKSGLVVIEEALDLLRATGTDRRPVRVIVTADEEIGSPTSAELLAAAAVGCTTAIGFESPHPSGDVKVGRLGSTRMQVDVAGIAAHAALDPQNGVSAAEEIVDQLVLIRGIVARAAAADADATVLYNLGCWARWTSSPPCASAPRSRSVACRTGRRGRRGPRTSSSPSVSRGCRSNWAVGRWDMRPLPVPPTPTCWGPRT
jgi:glutamate carboxypeptidase